MSSIKLKTKASPCGTSTKTDPCTGEQVEGCGASETPVFAEDAECCEEVEVDDCTGAGSYGGSLGVDLQCVVDDARRTGYHETGLRPYRVFLVWRRRRREIAPGREHVITRRIELVPVQLVALDSTDLELTSVGLDAVGGITLTQISPLQVSDDDLRGKIEGRDLDPSEEEFFYEVLHRPMPGQTTPKRRRYILASEPHHDGETFEYVGSLRAQAADVGANGEDQNLPPTLPRRKPELVS